MRRLHGCATSRMQPLHCGRDDSVHLKMLPQQRRIKLLGGRRFIVISVVSREYSPRTGISGEYSP
jgi:hypothetical protein